MMVENCHTESPSKYAASAPAASSYSSPHAATTKTLASRAMSMGRGGGVRHELSKADGSLLQPINRD